MTDSRGVLHADGPTVEEPMVAGDGVVEGGRRLVQQALVEWREHAVPSLRAGCPPVHY